jgi:hypothetical protein
MSIESHIVNSSFGLKQRVSFVLLLAPIPDRLECYRRVGMGIMLSPVQDDESLMKTIHIL